MPDYQKMYAILYGAISDALDAVEVGHMIEAEYVLQKAILKTEEMYICEESN